MSELASESVRVFDTTLRDGEQTPGVSLTPEEKMEIARALSRLGVDSIEAGFPIVSKGEFEAVKRIASAQLGPEICALARVEKRDIDVAAECDVQAMHVFIATSDIHLKSKLKISREEALRKAVEGVSYAKSKGVTVEFSAEDATRSDLEYLKKVFTSVVEVGADRLDIPDTVGICTPDKMSQLVHQVKSICNVPISVHCHDDFGFAVANSVAAVQAGASQAHVTVNGLGERAGNASLEEFVMALYCLYGKKTGIKTELLYKTSRLVSRLTGVIIQPNKAIVGENAFGHESGIHTHGVLQEPLTYEPISPELVGRKRWLQAGKHAGSHGLASQLKDMGVEATPEQVKQILAKVKEIGDKGKTLTDTDLMAISEAVTGQPSIRERYLQLEDIAVMTGLRNVPTASVRLTFEGKTLVSSATGVGPVDAAVKSIQKITDQIANIRLREYRLEALTGGSDALAEVIVKVGDDEGNNASARYAGEDIVVSSVQALIDGINRVLHKRKQISSLSPTATG